MLKERIVKFLQTKTFKKITFFLGIFFIALTIVISFNPEFFIQFGYLGVFGFNLFGGSGMFLIPSLARYMDIVGLALATGLGMAFNDSVAWIIGNSGVVMVPKNKKIKGIEHTVRKYGVYALFIWSFIPFPYDLVGLIAGYLGISYPAYIIPTFLGKFIRSILLGLGVLSLLK